MQLATVLYNFFPEIIILFTPLFSSYSSLFPCSSFPSSSPKSPSSLKAVSSSFPSFGTHLFLHNHSLQPLPSLCRPSISCCSGTVFPAVCHQKVSSPLTYSLKHLHTLWLNIQLHCRSPLLHSDLIPTRGFDSKPLAVGSNPDITP